MKVLMINGSPREKGCTFTALSEIASELRRFDVDSEILQLGSGPIRGCVACGGCRASHICVYDDIVNVAIEKAKDVDGFIFGTPVYYASANGSMISFMDRFFYTGHGYCAFKPGACVVSARRGGTTAAYDQMNKYIGISKMIMSPAPYWNMVHGSKPEDVKQDLEGLYIMRSIGRNMAWLIKALAKAAENGVTPPEQEPHVYTNFIR